MSTKASINDRDFTLSYFILCISVYATNPTIQVEIDKDSDDHAVLPGGEQYSPPPEVHGGR